MKYRIWLTVDFFENGAAKEFLPTPAKYFIEQLNLNGFSAELIKDDYFGFVVDTLLDENKIKDYLCKILKTNNVTIYALDGEIKDVVDEIFHFDEKEKNEELKVEETSSSEDSFINLTKETANNNTPQEKSKIDDKPDLKKIINTINEVRDILYRDIKGQNHVIEQVLNGYFGIEALPNNNKGPRGVFLFAGPPGVGKTMLAKLMSEKLGMPFLIVQMSEYSEQNAADTFIGTNGTYKNSAPGKVTSFVSENPKSILVFDEFEKAHHSILNIFLQILDNGVVADINTQKDVSFKDTIIIMTSNAGRNIYQDEQVNIPSLNSKIIMNALQTDINPVTNNNFFSPALLSRMNTGIVTMFNKLEPYFLRIILANELSRSFENFSNQYNININFDEDVVSMLLYSMGGSADARSLVGLANNFIKKELFELLDLALKGNVDINKIKNINFKVNKENAPIEVLDLFTPKDVTILFICKEEVKKLLEDISISNVRIRCASTLEDAKICLRGDVTFVAVDLLVNPKDESNIPASLEDINSDGIEIYNYIKDFYREVALYILNDKVNGYADSDFLKFLTYGARDILHLDRKNTIQLVEEIELLKSKSLVEKSSKTLSNSNQMVSYNCAQYFNGETVDVILQRLSLKRNIFMEDSADILSDLSRPTVKFDDVIGAEDAKETLKDFLKYLKNPKKYIESGVRPPRGVLLYGAPGTGKTLLAKALAGESNVAFIQKNATEFFKRYVGEGPESVRSMFKQARKYAPAIIFVDECDAFAKKRTGSDTSRSEEEILTTFLSELDGFTFDVKKPVLLVVATNYEISGNGSTVLDPAFVRRFDRKIRIDLPNTKEREQFLNYYLNKHGISTISDKTIENIAQRTYGYSPANIEMIIELAIRNAKGEDVTDKILVEAVDLDANGKEHKWSKEVMIKTSYHEAGHVLINWLCGKKPTFVTNVSRGSYGGYMIPEIDESDYTMTKDEILDDICCSLGGRAAEILVYGEKQGITTGASGDLRSATANARALITKYGMNGDSLISFEHSDYGDAIEEKIYNDINNILNEQLNRAIRLLNENKNKLDILTQELVKKNSLTKNDIINILSEVK